MCYDVIRARFISFDNTEIERTNPMPTNGEFKRISEKMVQELTDKL